MFNNFKICVHITKVFFFLIYRMGKKVVGAGQGTQNDS